MYMCMCNKMVRIKHIQMPSDKNRLKSKYKTPHKPHTTHTMNDEKESQLKLILRVIHPNQLVQHLNKI